MILTAKQHDSKDSLSCLCTAMSQLTSLLRASAEICEEMKYTCQNEQVKQKYQVITVIENNNNRGQLSQEYTFSLISILQTYIYIYIYATIIYIYYVNYKF